MSVDSGAISENVFAPAANECPGIVISPMYNTRTLSSNNLIYPKIKKVAKQKLAKKIEDIKALDLDYVITVNPGCTRQLVTSLRRAKVKTRVLHISQLIEMAVN